MDNFKNELKDSRETTRAYNKAKAEENNFDTTKGRSEYYQDLSTIKKEKDRAEEALEKAKNNSKIYTENKALKDVYQNALKSDKKAKKETEKLVKSGSKVLSNKEKELNKELEGFGDAKDLDRTNIEGELAEVNGHLNVFLTQAKEDLAKNVDGLENPEWMQRFDDLSKQEAELIEKRSALLEQLGQLDNIDEDRLTQLKGEINDVKEQQKSLTSDNLDVLMSWVDKNGSEDDKARAATIKGLMDAVKKADEDGVLTEDEAAQITQLGKECDRLIKEEMENNPEIRDAQDTYDSTKAKFSYFLFDQIKSIAVLLVGLSTGNASMIYSALDNFNKQISDAEAKYNTDTISALSNNNVKDIMGQADAQYVREQLVPELEKQKAYMQLDQEQKANSIIALEKAFEEFRRYVNRGGNEDFRAWFTAQTQSGNASGWAAVVMQLISAGALNWDIVNKVFSGGTSNGNNGLGDTIINGAKKKDPISFNIDTKGRTNKLMQNILKAGNDELIGKISTPAAAKDKQNTVNNVLASKLNARGAPQGQPLQTGQGWGSSIG